MANIRSFSEISDDDVGLAGGKAVGLAALLRAGLPVPSGFCITTEAYRRLNGQQLEADPALCSAIVQSYHELGSGLVAVRSSAVAEDGVLTSFAGQQETVLGVSGATAVLEAVARCWASLDSERAVAYRRFHAAEGAEPAMAVVVQQLVEAQVAGVLFTRDPLDPSGRHLIVEASWGLGESVVSGRVQPDRFRLDRETGLVHERSPGYKPVRRTGAGWEIVPEDQASRFCLDDQQLAELAELGRRVEAVLGGPRDLEWAWAEGRFWLLQARPITTISATEREEVRQAEIATLAALAEPEGTVWARYNLAESLPAPTPMTWALVRRMLSGRGGLGQMYRDLGFDPDPTLAEECVYDLVCGRPYCNLSREPRMQFRHLPFEHPFAALKAAPHKALYPQPIFNPARAGWRFWLFLPVHCWRQLRSARRLHRLSRTCAGELRQHVFPQFAAAARQELHADLTTLETPALLHRLKEWARHTLDDFARHALKPTVLAAVALGQLERELAFSQSPSAVRARLAELMQGVRPDPEADLPTALHALNCGQLSRQDFLDRFGHRGPNEMELSAPRWAEAPEQLLQGNPAPDGKHQLDVRDSHRDNLPLRTYLGLRETAKHYFMMGYAVLRRLLMELGRRHGIGDGIFFLLPDELPRLTAGHDLSALIAERRRRRAVALSLAVPAVLFSDDLEAIGRREAVPKGETLHGVPLSAGVAEGPALVLEKPRQASTGPGRYVLVCPSTDPAWVPLFLQAAALVLETGGVLSHGAIVAREFGLPAVAGLPGILQKIQTGHRIRVDGTAGTVTLVGGSAASSH